MDFDSVAQKLNTVFVENPDAREEKNAVFLYGDFCKAVGDLSVKLAPQGKCLYIALEETVIKRGAKLSAAIQNLGGKLYISSEKKSYDVSSKTCAGLFNFPDDIRLVICENPSLYAAATYFATVRGIPVVKAFDARTVGALLPSYADAFSLTCENYVIITPDCYKKSDGAYLFGYSMSKLVSLIDYRFDFKIRNRKVNAFCYDLAKKAVMSVFSLCKDVDNVDAGGLILGALSLCVADFLTDGDLFGYGASEETLRLIKSGTADASRYAFWSGIKATGIYDAAATGSVQFVPDYNERAEKLAADYGESEEEALKRFKIQIAFFKNNRREIDAFVKKIAPEIKSYAALSDTLIKKYLALGGKYLTENENARINAALRFAGDSMFNFASYARERGITEII